MKVIVDDNIPYIKGLIEQLCDEVVYLPGASISAEDVKDADIMIVRTRTRCDARLLTGSKVKLVVTATIGYDHFDTEFLRKAGIRWTNCPGCNANSVRQYVHNALLTCDVKDATIGVVGVGHVGSRVADDCLQAGMRVLMCDPPRARKEKDFSNTSLSEMAENCDIITFHTPLTREGEDATFHLADAEFFRSLRRKPIIINSSRGEVVDNNALVEALDNGLVSKAIIDTWEKEPDINRELLKRAYIATPHIAGYSADGKANATRMSLQAVADFLNVPFNLDVLPPTLPEGFSYGEVKTGELRLYDPRVDSERLKQNPEQFEKLRGSYPLRRE